MRGCVTDIHQQLAFSEALQPFNVARYGLLPSSLLACTFSLTNEAVGATKTQFGLANHDLVSRVLGEGIIQRISALAQCADWINSLAGDRYPNLDIVSGGTAFELDIPSELSSVSRAGDHSRLLFSIIHSAANNLLSVAQASKILPMILQNSNRKIFHALIAGQSPATQAFARTFMAGAIDSLDYFLVRALLGTGIGADSYVDNHRRRPLQIAISIRSLEMTELLLDHGADVNANLLLTSYTYSDGSTPLKAAVETGRLDIVQLLLRGGARVNDLEPGRGISALQMAAAKGKLGLVRLLLDAGADVNAPPYRYMGDTALQAAAGTGNVEIVQLLLSHGADVNAPDEEHRHMALGCAARSGNVDVTKLLLLYGATDVASALKLAGEYASVDVVNLLIRFWTTTHALLDDAFGRTALRAAIRCGDFGLVQMLLECKVSADAPCTGADTNWHTPLQIAADHGDIKIAELLMSYGADVNAPAAYGQATALRAAVIGNHIQLARNLLDHGADVNAPEYPNGRTALAEAAHLRNLQILHLLLSRGADMSTQGPSLVVEAVGSVPLELLRSLLDAWTLASGGNLEWTVNSYGATALEIAVMSDSDSNNTSLTRLLLEYEADDVSLALRRALSCRNINMELLELLIAAGAAVGRLHRYDYLESLSALGFAARADNVDFLRLLLEQPTTAAERAAALRVAAYYGRLDAAQLLLDHGTNINAITAVAYLESDIENVVRRPLQVAAGQGDLEMVRFLLAAGADVESKVPSETEEGTALQFAAIAGSMSIVTLLIQKGADVFAPEMGCDGRTALEGAAEHGRLDIVQLFLSLGAEVAGSRAIQFAREEGHDGVVALLEESA